MKPRLSGTYLIKLLRKIKCFLTLYLVVSEAEKASAMEIISDYLEVDKLIKVLADMLEFASCVDAVTQFTLE